MPYPKLDEAISLFTRLPHHVNNATHDELPLTYNRSNCTNVDVYRLRPVLLNHDNLTRVLHILSNHLNRVDDSVANNQDDVERKKALVLIPVLGHSCGKPHTTLLAITFNEHLNYHQSIIYDLGAAKKPKGFMQYYHYSPVRDAIAQAYGEASSIYSVPLDKDPEDIEKYTLSDCINRLTRYAVQQRQLGEMISKAATGTIGVHSGDSSTTYSNDSFPADAGAQDTKSDADDDIDDVMHEFYYLSKDSYANDSYADQSWYKRFYFSLLSALADNIIIAGLVAVIWAIYNFNKKLHDSSINGISSSISLGNVLFLLGGFVLWVYASSALLMSVGLGLASMSFWPVVTAVFIFATVGVASLYTFMGIANFLYHQAVRLYNYLTTGSSELQTFRVLSTDEQRRIIDAFSSEFELHDERDIDLENRQNFNECNEILNTIKKILRYCNHKIDKYHVLGCPIPYKRDKIEFYRKIRATIRCINKSSSQIRSDIRSVLKQVVEMMDKRDTECEYAKAFLLDGKETHYIEADMDRVLSELDTQFTKREAVENQDEESLMNTADTNTSNATTSSHSSQSSFEQVYANFAKFRSATEYEHLEFLRDKARDRTIRYVKHSDDDMNALQSTFTLREHKDDYFDNLSILWRMRNEARFFKRDFAKAREYDAKLSPKC